MVRSVFSIQGQIVRGIAYFILPVLIFAIANYLAARVGAAEVMREGGFVETTQWCTVAVTVALLLYCCREYPEHRGFLAVSATLGGLALIRELNNTVWYTKVFFFPGASTLFGLFVLAIVIWTYRRGLLDQIVLACRRISMLFLAGGGIVVIGWAQVLAQRPLFPDRLADRALEETLEAAGYLLIASGALEICIELRREKTRS